LPRLARASDEAVSEVLGYILMFFLSSAVLVLSLQAFVQSRAATSDLQAANELRLVSDRVANEVLQAGIVAGEFPNSTYEVSIPLPELPGRAFYVNASATTIWANTTDGKVAADATAFQVSQLGLQLAGSVYNSQGHVKVRYATVGGAKTILLTI
jgi:sensor domain CHASE-containing protein